jgi:hypothetical protein
MDSVAQGVSRVSSKGAKIKNGPEGEESRGPNATRNRGKEVIEGESRYALNYWTPVPFATPEGA